MVVALRREINAEETNHRPEGGINGKTNIHKSNHMENVFQDKRAKNAGSDADGS